MSGLYELLPKIQERPGMYIGSANLDSLDFFLVGYEFARSELSVEVREKEIEFYREFQPWLQKRFQVETVNSWAKIIRFYSHDEKEAFNFFFKLLSEFLARDKIDEQPDKISVA